MSADDPMTRCADCGAECRESELETPLERVRHLYERLDPGSEVPAGECECGALAYIHNEEGGDMPLRAEVDGDEDEAHDHAYNAADRADRYGDRGQ